MENKTKVPEWLQRVQENSWELELLISGGAVFSLFQLSGFFLEAVKELRITTHLEGQSTIIVIAMLGIKLLTLGFVTHLILRAYWVGLVCINYAFPKGIKEQSLKVKFPFTRLNQKTGNLQSQIINVDRFAGITMFFSVASSLFIAGLLFSIFFAGSVASRAIPDQSLFRSVYFTILPYVYLIYIFDFILFGLLRKIKVLSLLVFPFFMVLDFLTLRFAYKKAFLVYGSNISQWKVFLLILPFVLLGATLSYASLYRMMHWRTITDIREHRYNLTDPDKRMFVETYRDKIQGKIRSSSIQSEIISERFLRLYIPYRKEDDITFAMIADSIKAEYIADLAHITINGALVDSIDWYNYLASESHGMGLYGVIDIAALPVGKNEICLYNKGNKSKRLCIPFWKEEK